MSKITLLTFSYAPETTALAHRAGAMAEHLVSRGWEVTVITQAPNYPQGRIYDGYGGKPVVVTEEDGIRIVRLRPWLVSRSNLPLRLLAEGYFAFRAARQARRFDTDLVFSTSPYMFLGPAGWLLSKWTRSPFVWEIRDLTWRYPAAAGKRTFGADRLLEALMMWTASRARALVTTTAGQLEYFRTNGAGVTNGQVIPNGVSQDFLDLVDHKKAAPGARTRKPNVVYAGLLGFAQGLAAIVGAAAYLKDVQFYLVGDGAQRAGLERMAEEQRIKNVSFEGYVSVEKVVDYYLNANVLVAHLRRDPVFEITQPSKVWEYMATGRPVVYGGEGEAAEAVRKSGGGVVVSPDDPESMAEAIRRYIEDPDYAEETGRKGRDFVLREKRREDILGVLEQGLRQIVGLPNQAPEAEKVRRSKEVTEAGPQ